MFDVFSDTKIGRFFSPLYVVSHEVGGTILARSPAPQSGVWSCRAGGVRIWGLKADWTPGIGLCNLRLVGYWSGDLNRGTGNVGFGIGP